MKINESFSSKIIFSNKPENQLKPINFITKKNTNIYYNKILFCITLLIIFIIFIEIKKIHIYINNNQNFDIHFNYEEYEKDIITNKIKIYSGWELTEKEAYFINGIIRKNHLKKCLEIGVSNGGSSILILNSIKNIKNSFLVSLDLNTQLYKDRTKKTGYRVDKYFPELKNKWKLYTGDQPHKFLVNLNIKFDFLFLDTKHRAPGELINFIEALPFLNENAIVVVHDLLWHIYMSSKLGKKIFPSCISLFPAINGEKALLGYSNSIITNIGAVYLNSHQEKYYINYFLLLLNFWDYMPNDNQINDLRIFIKNYYKKDIYLNIFEKAVFYNKKIFDRLNLNKIFNNNKSI